ncbi:MAG: alpha/beta hydrolase, partial [Acidimicrobiales bacterium]
MKIPRGDLVGRVAGIATGVAFFAGAATLLGVVLASGGAKPVPLNPTAKPGQGTASPTDLSVDFTGAGGLTLGGTLLLPPGSGPRTPAVVIVPDDGATNRDGLEPPNSLADPLYSDLAGALESAGIASLRYDRRGEGASAVPPGSDISLAEVTSDVQGALGFLAGRTDVDRSELGLVGDGQGGLVAAQVAATDPVVRSLVLVSTPGRP